MRTSFREFSLVCACQPRACYLITRSGASSRDQSRVRQVYVRRAMQDICRHSLGEAAEPVVSGWSLLPSPARGIRAPSMARWRLRECVFNGIRYICTGDAHSLAPSPLLCRYTVSFLPVRGVCLSKAISPLPLFAPPTALTISRPIAATEVMGQVEEAAASSPNPSRPYVAAPFIAVHRLAELYANSQVHLASR